MMSFDFLPQLYDPDLESCHTENEFRLDNQNTELG